VENLLCAERGGEEVSSDLQALIETPLGVRGVNRARISLFRPESKITEQTLFFYPFFLPHFILRAPFFTSVSLSLSPALPLASSSSSRPTL